MELLEKPVTQKQCPRCSILVNTEDFKLFADKYLCGACFEKFIKPCSDCNQLVWLDDLRDVADRKVCKDCMYANYRECNGCGVYVKPEIARYSDLQDAYYCEGCESENVTYCQDCGSEIDSACCFRRGDSTYCEECYDRMAENGELVQHHEFSSHRFRICKSNRKYGVEIEAILQEEESHFPVDELGAWSKQRDSSLGDWGMEFASPILQGDDGFMNIAGFTQKLINWNYHVDKRCGLHVHIDGRDLDYQHIKKLLKIAVMFEPVIYAMLPESRFTGSFSVPLNRFPKSRFKFKVKDEQDLKRLWYGRRNARVNTKSKFDNSRYFGVNIHSWFFRRSIEFRYHSGTLNPMKITSFITICQAFVDESKKRGDFRFSVFESFDEQFDSFCRLLRLSAKIKTYVRQRIMKFHPEKLAITAASLAADLQ